MSGAALADNDPSDRYQYQMVVVTGQRRGAGTRSKVEAPSSRGRDRTRLWLSVCRFISCCQVMRRTRVCAPSRIHHASSCNGTASIRFSSRRNDHWVVSIICTSGMTTLARARMPRGFSNMCSCKICRPSTSLTSSVSSGWLSREAMVWYVDSSDDVRSIMLVCLFHLVGRSNACCQWPVPTRRNKRRISSRRRYRIKCPIIICGIRSSHGHRRVVSLVCNGARAVLCCSCCACFSTSCTMTVPRRQQRMGQGRV
jgi:hypothetical protein